LPSKSYDFRNNKLSYTAGVAEWGVEHSDSMLSCVLDIDLICSNTKASNNDQTFGFSKHPSSKFRLRAYANDVNITVIDKP